MAYKGNFKPLHPEKYVGDVKNITYRSSWELKVMMVLDRTPAVEAWNSEGLAIPYFDPAHGKTGKFRRYYPDFLIKLRDKNGKLKTWLIEVKPAHEMAPPEVKGKKKRKLLREASTFITNQAKWRAAQTFCEQQGWGFRVMNEHDLGIR